MEQPDLKHLGLPAIDQIGFVVRDMDAAVKQYEPLFGPFSRMDAPVEAADYRGQLADCELKLAFARSGELEIELIEWVSGDSPHREFIESGREGMHHLRYRVDDLDAWLPRLETVGYRPIWYKQFSADTIFCYLQREGDSLTVELLQMPTA